MANRIVKKTYGQLDRPEQGQAIDLDGFEVSLAFLDQGFVAKHGGDDCPLFFLIDEAMHTADFIGYTKPGR